MAGLSYEPLVQTHPDTQGTPDGYQALYEKNTGLDNVVDFNLYCSNSGSYFGDEGPFTATVVGHAV